jgi:hypothetical protein
MVVVATAAAASLFHILVPPLHPMQDGQRLLASSLFDAHLRHLHPPLIASLFSSFSS